jgi:hypothetical protein
LKFVTEHKKTNCDNTANAQENRKETEGKEVLLMFILFNNAVSTAEIIQCKMR